MFCRSPCSVGHHVLSVTMFCRSRCSAGCHACTLTQRRELLLKRSPERRQVSQGVGVVDLAQHIVGQADAGDSPPAMQWSAGRRAQLRRVIEVLVEGLEEPPMRLPELFDAAAGIAVGAEQNAVLILKEKLADQ